MTARVLRIAARTAILAFCWTTTIYAFITSSAFAYLQFIKPRVFRWIGTFSDWHPWASCAWLALLTIYLWPLLRVFAVPWRREAELGTALGVLT